MFFFKKKRSKPQIKFFNSVPGVNTLYPITKSIELDREWVSYEKNEYKNTVSKCPMARFGENFINKDNKLPEELSNIINFSQDTHRDNIQKPLSLGHCPGINSIMHNGFVIYAPADFSVYAKDNTNLECYWDKAFPPVDGEYTKTYIEYHTQSHTKWLKDSSKDSTNDVIIKVCTMWNVIADPDIVFLVMKVPYMKESRFSAVTGILDPTLCPPEVNIQLWWHNNDGKETTIKSGTPLAVYIPISRKTLEYNSVVTDITSDDKDMMKEYFYLRNGMNFSENHKNLTKISRKIYNKYWNKFRES